MYDEPRASGVSRLAAWLGAISLVALAATGPLHRIGLVGLTGTFNLLKWAVYGALAGMALAIIGIIVDVRREARTSTALTAMLMSFIATGSIAALAWKASHVPPIHDVTTDTMQPPPFLAVVPLREGAHFMRQRRAIRDALAAHGIASEIDTLVTKLLDR